MYPQERKTRVSKRNGSRYKLKAIALCVLALLLLIFCSDVWKLPTRRLFSANIPHPLLPTRSMFSANIPHPWHCTFDPDDLAECNAMLSGRLPPPTKYLLPGVSQKVERQRWLFFGDSTMSRLYHFSDLKNRLTPQTGQGNCPVQDIVCEEHAEIRGNQCGLHDVFGLERTKEWIRPDGSKDEGPHGFGLLNPYCKDCSSCLSHFHECTHVPLEVLGTKVKSSDLGCANTKQVYGGYFAQNFVRDVELQTPELRTTQENYAAYISRKWNTPELVRDWGKPICVVREGMHDVLQRAYQLAVRGDFDHKFMDNIRWLLKRYQPVCQHIVWIGNTANGNEGNTTLYPHMLTQTMSNMIQIDTDVKDVIESDPELHAMVSFIDVHNASLFRPHADFVHMKQSWCKDLGGWLSSFM